MDKASNPGLDRSTESRGTFLTVMAVLFVVLAISDFTKALQYANNPAVGGLVVVGTSLRASRSISCSARCSAWCC